MRTAKFCTSTTSSFYGNRELDHSLLKARIHWALKFRLASGQVRARRAVARPAGTLSGQIGQTAVPRRSVGLVEAVMRDKDSWRAKCVEIKWLDMRDKFFD